MKFNELPVGTYFLWKQQTYRKIASGKVLSLGNDSILDFGLNHEVEVTSRPNNRLDVLIQYLGWAMIQAFCEANPGATKVNITLDLPRKTIIYSEK